MIKVLVAGSEMNPIAKVGGLADVIGALPKALPRKQVDCSIALPYYRDINLKELAIDRQSTDITVIFEEREYIVKIYSAKLRNYASQIYLFYNYHFLSNGSIYFSQSAFCDSKREVERFNFFSLAVNEAIRQNIIKCDVVHANDWHTGSLVRNVSKPTLFTIHNIANQGKLGRGPNYMALGIDNATIVNTVSKTYVEELKSPRFGEGLSKNIIARQKDFFGILNGIDYDYFNPATDKIIYKQYSSKLIESKTANKVFLLTKCGLPTTNGPLIGLVSRLTQQKGIDIAVKSLKQYLNKYDATFIALGVGNRVYEQELRHLQKQFPKKAKIFIEFNDELARQIFAGSDMFLMPSRFEPCGLGQMISMRFGSIPIVHQTGGLQDSVKHKVNGIVFKGLKTSTLTDAIINATEIYSHRQAEWRKMILNGMNTDCSWTKSAKQYVKLYQLAIKKYAKSHRD